MPVSEGLKNSLNAIREISSEIYHRYVPIITDDTSIEQFSSPIMNYKPVQNEFIEALINRIVYTQFEIKYFRNPLQVLEGDEMPLGDTGQEVYINPAKGRKFNVNDFAGLLQKYESDVKVQYMSLNMDVQYPVTVSRQTLKKAFVSWSDLESFINGITQSLYNGAYIDEYKFTKNIVSSAYKNNKAIIRKVDAPTTEALAKQFITMGRQMFLDMQVPSSNFNSWSKLGGYGKPIVTWTEPENIVFLIRNELRAYLDVNVLAQAFNIDRTTLLGNIISIDNFDVYDDEGQKVFDGSNIVGFIGDKRWFRIKRQDLFMDTFYNGNNRTTQFFLNLIKMYNMSLFANGVIFATELPTGIATTDVTLNKSTLTDGENYLGMTVTPVNGTDKLTVSVDSTNSSKVTAQILSPNTLKVDVSEAPTNPVKLTFKAGSFSKEISLTYNGVLTASIETVKTTTSTKSSK